MADESRKRLTEQLRSPRVRALNKKLMDEKLASLTPEQKEAALKRWKKKLPDDRDADTGALDPL